MQLAVIDGRLCGPADATISVFDRGVLFGDGVLETMRTYSSQPFELARHLDRLGRSLDAVGIAWPCTQAQLSEEVHGAIRAANHRESIVRIIVTRGPAGGGLAPRDGSSPTRIVTVEPCADVPVELLRRGLRVQAIRTVRAADAVRSAKLTNYLASVLATRDARELGADEAVLLDADGRVLEGATFNVFAVRGGTLLTPAAGCGVLDGITRAIVLELAARAGLAVAFEALRPEALARADEAFATSSLREILAIHSVNGVPLSSAPGPWTRRLHGDYRTYAGAPPPPYDDGECAPAAPTALTP